MENDSSSKDKKPQERATQKLHFLLDTIETELTDMAEVVELQGPILEQAAAHEEHTIAGLHHEGMVTDDLDLDVDFSEESDEPSPEAETADEEALAALEAMSDAEVEVEAMLTEDVATVTEDSPAVATSEDEVDVDVAQALKELLTTREVDVSKLLEKQPMQKQPAGKPSSNATELFEDLFDDLDIPVESEQNDTGAAEPPAIDDQLPRDLLADLNVPPEVEERDATTAKPVTPEREFAEDLLTELELDGTGNGEAGTAGGASISPASDEELATLLNKKIEALVIRVVEKQLSAIAERVLRDKINKIFKSMK